MTHERESRLLILAGIMSVSVALLLIATKLVAWWMTDSVSILASLVDSLMDSLASLVNLLAIRYALVPADEDHRFGHGKAEALAGLGQALFIAGSSVFLITEAIGKLVNPRPLEALDVGIGVMVFSMVITSLLVLFQRYVISQTKSTAIHADSTHYVADLATNAGILLALFIAQYGLLWIDGVAGIIVAIFILYAAWHIGYEAAQLLLDRELPEQTRQDIAALVISHDDVLGFHDLRTRQSGRTQFIQLHVEMDKSLLLEQAHDLAESIEAQIVNAFPAAEVIIHEDPTESAQFEELKTEG